MIETMYAADGVGLAATQVDVHERVIVMDTTDSRDRPRVLINPELVSQSEEMVLAEEGCLSVPGVFDTLRTRSEKIRVRALDRDGQPFEIDAEGLLAVCIQHEIDHLDGKLFVDYLSELKRNRIRKKLEKERRERTPVAAGAVRTPAL
jgi:peptide deformylase